MHLETAEIQFGDQWTCLAADGVDYQFLRLSLGTLSTKFLELRCSRDSVIDKIYSVNKTAC